MKLEKNEVLQRINELSARERLLAMGGAIVVLLYGAYGLFYEPLSAENLRLQQKIQAQRQNYQYLQSLSREVDDLRQRAGGLESAVDAEGQSPLAIVDSSSQQLEIKPAIKRSSPQGEDKVTVELEDVAFDKLVYWLAILEQKHRLSVIQIEVEQAAETGLVNARLSLGN